MGDWLFVQINNCFNDISQILNSLFDSKMVDLVKVVEQCSTIQVLHNEVKIVILLKKSEELHDIWVIEGFM